jgi:hypothetical protein
MVQRSWAPSFVCSRGARTTARKTVLAACRLYPCIQAAWWWRRLVVQTQLTKRYRSPQTLVDLTPVPPYTIKRPRTSAYSNSPYPASHLCTDAHRSIANGAHAVHHVHSNRVQWSKRLGGAIPVSKINNRWNGVFLETRCWTAAGM